MKQTFFLFLILKCIFTVKIKQNMPITVEMEVSIGGEKAGSI